MNIIRHADFFNPVEIDDAIHVIGVGAIGSNLAMQLARLGLSNIYIYDFDIVGDHNIPNQHFDFNQIGMPKVEATYDNMLDVNPTAIIHKRPEGYTSQPLSGYVFLCVDSIETRKKIVQSLMYKSNIKGVFDLRMGLEEAQVYSMDWADKNNRNILMKSMDFTQEEADAAMPVSACGTKLCVLPTIQHAVSIGVAQFILLTKGEPLQRTVIVNPFDAATVAL